MALDSKSPEEVLAFWRDLKSAIRDRVKLSEVYDLSEIIDFVLEDSDAMERLADELEHKSHKDFALRLAEAHGLIKEES
jgi:hypothetical protein